MIDSHSHVAGSAFVDDLEAVVERARTAGVERALVILAADDEEEIARAAVVRNAWPGVGFAVGIHPHNAQAFADRPDAAARLLEARLAAVPAARAVGEIGLDYFYKHATAAAQDAVFRAQLRVARAHDLPVVLHIRDAEDDALRVLAEEGAGSGLRGVFHCFTGDPASAERALATGFYLSIPGIVTFPKSTAMRETAAMVPPDRLLIETDSPYLAPVPHRGTRNEPAYVMRTLDAVAAARAVPAADLGAQLVTNFDALFGRW